MGSWAGGHWRNRGDRYVRRARLSAPAEAPARKLAFTIEEALRLATLPGENEGRSYYFRTLRLAGLPANGDRAIWLDRFQQALNQAAAQAVHAGDPRAALANSVYFQNDQEALEILLHRLLARRPVDEWYWSRVTVAAGTGGSQVSPQSPSSSLATICGIVEELRARPASWVAVARALFAAPGFDVARLFAAITPAAAHQWLREMDGGAVLRNPPAVAIPRAAEIPRAAQAAIRQALRAFGSRDARTVWLAVMAILIERPGDLATRTAVPRARAALQQLEQLQQGEGSRGIETVAPATESSVGRPESNLAEPLGLPPSHEETSAEFGAPAPADSVAPPNFGAESASALTPGPEELAELPVPLPWQWTGDPTAAAGLFFLLNVLDRIGIADALAAFGAAVPDFAARVLERLAIQAGAAPGDPIRVWLDSLISGAAAGGPLSCGATWWPANLPRSAEITTVADLVRAWSLGVRRWCWRAGRLGVRDIVTRGGLFSVNRTDLDVSLPLEEADVRVRRIGLDLDPGWLPWFGRVVRFHYVSRGELHA